MIGWQPSARVSPQKCSIFQKCPLFTHGHKMEVQAIGIEPPLELQHYDRVKAEKKAFCMDPALELVPVRSC